jgi:hypothetical protein
VLAKALLAEGKTQEAEKTIQEALRLVEPTSNRQWHLEVGVAAARVEAATGSHAAAATRLRKIRADAKGFLAVEFDADMALGEVEIASGQVAQGRSRLEALERQARSKGFLLVANQAASARRSRLAVSARRTTLRELIAAFPQPPRRACVTPADTTTQSIAVSGWRSQSPKR